MKLLLVLVLSCTGLQQARSICEQVRLSLPGATRHYNSDSTGSKLARWFKSAKVPRKTSALRASLDRQIARNGFSVKLATERGFAYLAEGRAAESLSDFLGAAKTDPEWPTPAQVAIISFALLWPSLDEAQRKDGYDSILGALGERFESTVVH